MQTQSLQGSSYIATFVDDHLRHVVIYFLKTKDQFVHALKIFLAWGDTQTPHKLRALHSDRGGEYIAGTITDLLEEKGIECHMTMPGLPQQNGLAERFNCTIMEKAQAMLHTAGMSPGFWEYAVHTAAHIYNRSPTRVLSWRTPYEVWNSGQVLDVSHIRTFGCKVYMHIPADKRGKLDVKVSEVTLVGYESGAKGYRLWDRQARTLRLSRDVTFYEGVFLFHQSAEPHSEPVFPVPSVLVTFSPSLAPTAPNPPAPAVPCPPAPAEPIQLAPLAPLPPARLPSPAQQPSTLSVASEEEVSTLLRPSRDVQGYWVAQGAVTHTDKEQRRLLSCSYDLEVR